jgi:type VI secretion system protein ImpF
MHVVSTHPPLPFFDRFGAPAARPEGAQLTPIEALQLSLELDLTRLFNTRNSLSIEQFLEGAPTSLDYGLPDTLRLSPQSATDLQRWALVILHAVALYEPRLIQVHVSVLPDATRPTTARVVIDAAALLHGRLCQFHFDTALNAPETPD